MGFQWIPMDPRYVSNLLTDAAALSAHCRELWDDVGAVDVLPQEELQPVTQRLIDGLGCRHPSSLERIGQVYSTFAHRKGDLTADLDVMNVMNVMRMTIIVML